MRTTLLLMLISATALAEDKTVNIKVPPLPPSVEEALAVELSDVQFAPHRDMKGVQTALIGMDPVSTGTTGYLKTVGGGGFPPHWSTHNVQYVQVAGKGKLTVGDKSRATGPGSFTVVLSKTRHGFSCDKGADCIFVVRHAGPPDVNFAAPAK
jgi:mannose-6-phosphate isomerase-like protein (cupin superfamily)